MVRVIGFYAFVSLQTEGTHSEVLGMSVVLLAYPEARLHHSSTYTLAWDFILWILLFDIQFVACVNVIWVMASAGLGQSHLIFL